MSGINIKNGLLLFALISLSPIALAIEKGQQIIDEKCTRCHDAPDPAKLTKKQWVIKVNKMAPHARLTADEKTSVLDYVSANAKDAATVLSMATEKKLFEDKCSLCHSTTRALIMPMTAESVREIVMRMQSMAGSWINDDQAQQISEYLVHGAPESKRPTRKEIATSNPYALFLQRCTACHTAEQVFARLESDKKGKTAENWSEIVNRMQAKAPNWLTPPEASTITTFLTGLK